MRNIIRFHLHLVNREKIFFAPSSILHLLEDFSPEIKLIFLILTPNMVVLKNEKIDPKTPPPLIQLVKTSFCTF